MTETAERQIALAAHLLDVDRPSDALEQLGRLPAESGSSETVWALRVRALLALERTGDAASAASAGLAEVGQSVWLLHLLALARSDLRDYAGAEQALLAALRLEPEDEVLLCSYVRLLLRVGQVQKAERLLAQAARLAPESRAVLEARALLVYVTGSSRQVTGASREVLRHDPDSTLGRTLLAGSASERGDFRTSSRLLGGLAAESGDRELREAARINRAYRSPWLLPLWPLERFGAPAVWLAWIVLMFGLSALGLEQVLVVLIPLYLLLVVYSWVAPPLVRRWARR